MRTSQLTHGWIIILPTNSSVVTKQELKILQSYEVYRNDAKEFMELVDTKIMKPFKRYFKKHDLDMKLLDEVRSFKR